MMASHLYLVRHGRTQPDPDTPAALWPLSEAGRAETARLATDPRWAEVACFYSSPEEKAIVTARLLAEPHGRAVEIVPDLREVERGLAFFADYEAAVLPFFARPAESVHGWERAVDAGRRVATCLKEIGGRAGDGPVAVVSHGLALTLGLAVLVPLGPDLWEFWRQIGFSSAAVLDLARRRLAQGFHRPKGEVTGQIDALRERLFEKYGEMPDSVDLIRDDRGR
jgi:broad specificity phosphatase PhoE